MRSGSAADWARCCSHGARKHAGPGVRVRTRPLAATPALGALAGGGGRAARGPGSVVGGAPKPRRVGSDEPGCPDRRGRHDRQHRGGATTQPDCRPRPGRRTLPADPSGHACRGPRPRPVSAFSITLGAAMRGGDRRPDRFPNRQTLRHIRRLWSRDDTAMSSPSRRRRMSRSWVTRRCSGSDLGRRRRLALGLGPGQVRHWGRRRWRLALGRGALGQVRSRGAGGGGWSRNGFEHPMSS